MRALSTFCGLAALFLAAAPCRAAAEEMPSQNVWYTIVADDGAALGHASDESVLRADGREFIQEQEIYVAETGGAATRIARRMVFSIDQNERLTRIRASSEGGETRASVEAVIADGRARIVRETPSGREQREVALPAGVRFDDGELLLRGWDPAAAPRIEFETFDIDAMDVERVVIEAASVADDRIIALRRRYEGETLVGVARLTLDRSGRILEIAQPMFNATIRIVTTDRDTALAPHPPYHVVPNAMMRSPFRVSSAASQRHIRMQFSFRDGIAFALPQTDEQGARTGPASVTVDICETCGPGLGADAGALADALKPTAWMQSDDPRIREIAQGVARLGVSDARKMQLLSDHVREIITHFDYSGHYSALEALTRHSGDCTEAAVLLGALGRAAGIPTRIASGIAYTRESYHGVSNAFMPHTWTLAWVDGRWRSFDAALDGFDNTHVALSIGDGDLRSIAAAGQLASLLQIEAMAEVRPRGGD